jgi:hypothetical protein
MVRKWKASNPNSVSNPKKENGIEREEINK